MKLRGLHSLVILLLVFFSSYRVLAYYDDYGVDCYSTYSGIELDYDGEKFKGLVTISLKRVIERNCNFELPLRHLRIERIIIIGKGKKRGSSVRLQMGRHHSQIRYFSDDYQRIIYRPQRLHRRGPMRLHFRGKVKMEKIIIQFQTRRRGGVIFDG